MVDGGGEKWEKQEGQAFEPALPSLSDLPGGPCFMGRFAHSLDDKRRVAIPKAFREELKLGPNSTFFVIPAFSDPCLWLYTDIQFQELKARLQKMQDPVYGVGSEAIRAFRREVFSRGAKVAPDKQGRIALPPELCGYVGIDKEIVFLGVDEHIELWSPLAEQLKDDPERFRKLSKELLG
ncbi:MAG: division/cell wall cluster transcriptional repressor MraZ [Planctomycetota bacterium]